jgi:endogenous inhibitor of DNA gyrase (YacG/DUF329 family)
VATVITVTCPDCGVVAVSPENVSVVEVPWDEEANTYTFTCPKCKGAFTKPAPLAILALLATSRHPIKWTKLCRDEEVALDKPPLTTDDLLDLILELEQL